MSAKQRHKQRVTKRLKEKLENVTSMEKTLYAVVKDHVSKAEKRCLNVINIEDTSVFLQQYGKIEQELDGVLNFLELLTSSAEDMIETVDLESGDEASFNTDRLLMSSTYSLGDEMIQSSSRKRHSSSEAASQTVSDEIGIKFNDSLCKGIQSFCEGKGNVKDCNSIQTVKETSIEVEVYESDSNFEEENTVSALQTFSPQAIMESGENKNSGQNTNLESVRNVRESSLEKGVPERVKKHLLKETNPGSDESGSSFCNSLAFGKDVTLTSSPKIKSKSPRKKKSPKKKNIKSNTVNKEKDLNTENRNILPVKELSEGSLPISKQEAEKSRKWKEQGACVTNPPVLKSDLSELSSEPTLTSSEQSILEHELTKMMPTTDSYETSSSSGIKSLSVKDGQVVLYTKHMSSGVIIESESHSSQKSQLVESEHGSKNAITQGHKSDEQETVEHNSATAQIRHESQAAEVLTDNMRNRPGKETVKTNDAILNPGSLLPGRITPVIVSEVVSPWCFFVQQNGTQLNQLMEQICLHIAQGGLSESPLMEPEMGTLCLARYSKDAIFYRAYVTQVHRTIQKHLSEVDVLYVDYGNRERVKVTHLRRLPEKFKILPTQAICCALAEVKPCNKYCVWAEDDVNMFRQYVAGNQLSCTPPTCRSSSESHPLLVALFVTLPVPTGLQGSIHLTQFSIAQLLIKNKKATHVEVCDQLGLLVKSGEGAEESAILSHNISATSRLAITELSDSHCDQPAENTLCESLQKEDWHETPEKNEKCLEVKEEHMEVVVEEQVNVLVMNTSSTEVTSSDSKSKPAGTCLISPCSETSDTESQWDEGLKGTGKPQEKGQNVSQTTGSRGQLDKIKEETVDLESCETASIANSFSTDLDFPPGQGMHLSDLHFELDDLHFNPHGQEVMIAHVKTPAEFFVHIISQQSGETLDRLMKNLNSLFETANRRKLTRLSKTFEVAENKLCCAQFLQDNSFYRGIILRTKPEKEIMKGRVLVHYIDFGDEEWLPKRRIFPLPLQFCNVPRLALKCSLAYIKPVCDKEEPVKWSDESVEKFVNIVGLEKTITMHVVQGCLEDLKKGDPCIEPPVLGVLLLDNTGTEEVCVNMDLINEGVAQLDTDQSRQARDTTSGDTAQSKQARDLTSGETDQSKQTRDTTSGDIDQSKRARDTTSEMSHETRLEKWNPMEEDFMSVRNSYNVDIDDAGVATTGYKARDEERICKFYSMGKDCWRGERCPYRHIVVESGMTYDKEPVFATFDDQAKILPNPGSWVAIEISTILSPSHFYAILPMGNKSLDATTSEPERFESAFGETGTEETLDDLLHALNTEYGKRPAHQGNLLLRAIGEIVVARFSEDQSWYRARVVEVTEEKVKVFYVDFGNTEWLQQSDIVDIKPEFLHLPFQAIECFMNVEPKEEKWMKDTKIEFRELVDGKTLVGHVKSRSWNGCLWVELYDTTTEEDVNIGEELVKRGHALKGESQGSHTDNSGSVSCPSGEILLVPG